MVSTHSRPKAAGPQELRQMPLDDVSTHSRPKAAGSGTPVSMPNTVFQHTAARRRLVSFRIWQKRLKKFQHTAARRRLAYKDLSKTGGYYVSTHSRPKAAGGGNSDGNGDGSGFNTQPPEGGWPYRCRWAQWVRLFQHTAARRRLGTRIVVCNLCRTVSTHSRPKAAGRL